MDIITKSVKYIITHLLIYLSLF